MLQIDAFTSVPFKGNPAAVCFLDRERDDRWMRDVAAEMNLAETAFLLPRGREWSLRWFTPTVEVDLCGHATLASAHALWEERLLPPDRPARFHTRSGLLTAERTHDLIVMDFPSTPAQAAEPPAPLLAALGARPSFVGKSPFDYLLELDSEEAVRALRPDLAALRALPGRGVIVTSRPAGGEYDFVSRFFAPAAGVDEDPVTGSAHCCLAPYWASRLGKRELTGYQASPRGGVVKVGLNGDRVRLAGAAVTVLRGELTV
jgi:predicted PhzF superfamily epimerase YddE/YHI9